MKECLMGLFVKMLDPDLEKNTIYLEWNEQRIKFEENKNVDELTPPHEPEGDVRLGSLHSGCEFYDDVSGEQLDHGLTTQARKVDIDFFKKI